MLKRSETLATLSTFQPRNSYNFENFYSNNRHTPGAKFSTDDTYHNNNDQHNGYNNNYNSNKSNNEKITNVYNSPRYTPSSFTTATSANSSPRYTTFKDTKLQNGKPIIGTNPNSNGGKANADNRISHQLIVEQFSKTKGPNLVRVFRSPTESQPMNMAVRKPSGSDGVKGMTIGKMIMMSSGERTKLIENRIQDRLLDKRLQEIQKQATKNEMQIKRARSMLLDEYMQRKALNMTSNNGNNKLTSTPIPTKPKTITQKVIEQSEYLPSYMRGKKLPTTAISQDYDYTERLERQRRVAEKNRTLCSRHKRHLRSGEFAQAVAQAEEIERAIQGDQPQQQPQTNGTTNPDAQATPHPSSARTSNKSPHNDTSRLNDHLEVVNLESENEN